MARVPELTREQLPQDQRHIYDEIAGSRGGQVTAPFKALLNSPQVAARVAHMGAYLRFESSLEPWVRVLATLTTAREWDCQYEWTVNEPRAQEAGLGGEAVMAVRDRETPAGLTDQEVLLVTYVQELIRDHRVREETFSATLQWLGPQGVTDLTATIGYYSLLALLLNAFEVEPAPGVSSLLPI